TQRNLTIDYLIDNGYSEEEAEAEADFYEETGALEKQARLAVRYLDKVQADQIEAEKARDLAENKLREERAAFEHEKIKNEIINLKKLKDLDLPEGTGQELYDYIYKPVRNGKSKSQLDGENPENRML